MVRVSHVALPPKTWKASSEMSHHELPRPSIREARPADVPAVLALWRTDGVPSSRTDDATSVSTVLAHPTSTLLLAEVNGDIVGSVIAAWNGWRGALYRLVVAPSHRRSGVATLLVRAAEEILIDFGARRLHALVLEQADPAQQFWRSAGYEAFRDVALFTRNDP
jgi:ribosomal protein S18 acetylase RimI-like enzyme